MSSFSLSINGSSRTVDVAPDTGRRVTRLPFVHAGFEVVAPKSYG